MVLLKMRSITRTRQSSRKMMTMVLASLTALPSQETSRCKVDVVAVAGRCAREQFRKTLTRLGSSLARTSDIRTVVDEVEVAEVAEVETTVVVGVAAEDEVVVMAMMEEIMMEAITRTTTTRVTTTIVVVASVVEATTIVVVVVAIKVVAVATTMEAMATASTEVVAAGAASNVRLVIHSPMLSANSNSSSASNKTNSD